MAFCDNAIALFDDCAKMAVSRWSREWERGISGHVWALAKWAHASSEAFHWPVILSHFFGEFVMSEI